MSYLVGGFRSTVPESAGWNSHIPEPDQEDDEEEEPMPEVWVMPDGDSYALTVLRESLLAHGARQAAGALLVEDGLEAGACRAAVILRRVLGPGYTALDVLTIAGQAVRAAVGEGDR